MNRTGEYSMTIPVRYKFLVLKKQFNGFKQKKLNRTLLNMIEHSLYVLFFKKNMFNRILSISFSFLTTLDLESLFNEGNRLFLFWKMFLLLVSYPEFFGYLGTYIYSVLEWNWRALSEKFLEFRVSSLA